MMARRVLFYRYWDQYSGGTNGGQLKVRDAFDHLKSSSRYNPCVFFDPRTIWYDNPGNHWLDLKDQGLRNWEINQDDILLLSGKDWAFLPEDFRCNPKVPIVNIAQPRHVRLSDPRREYLQYPAIRIAKSSIGKEILEHFPVNGPVFLIPDCIDHSLLPQANTRPTYKVLIVGLKNKQIALELQAKLRYYNFIHPFRQIKFTVQLPPPLPTRIDFLHLLNNADIICFLPLPESQGYEGFYLPALEAMALKKLVICPLVIGNRDFCIPNITCIQPEYHIDALFKSILDATQMPKYQTEKIRDAAWQMSLKHDISVERELLLKLMDQVDDIWNHKDLFNRQNKSNNE